MTAAAATASATAIRPYRFGQEFADPRAEAADPIAALEAENDALRVAVEQARAEGAREALAALEAQRDTALLAAVQALTASLARLDQRFDDTEQAIASAGADLAHAIAEQLAAQAVAREPLGAVMQAILTTLQQNRRGQPLRVRIASDLVAPLEALVADAQATERRRMAVTVLADPALLPGDATLEWDSGRLLVDRAARAEAVRAELASLAAA